jgi:hypothetical protein
VVRTKKVNSSKEIRRSWYHAIDTKHVYILVKFERRLSVQFERKKKNKTFSKGMAQPAFFVKNDLFLRTEIDNLLSNFTRTWICFVSTAGNRETCIWMLDESMDATISPKKATDWSGTYHLQKFHRLGRLADVGHEIFVYTWSGWYGLLGGGEQLGYFCSRISLSKENITWHQRWKWIRCKNVSTTSWQQSGV